jgi:two-component system NtrC family sensor kinase
MFARLPLYQVYYLLGVIAIALLSLSLYVGHQNLVVFKDSVVSNESYVSVQMQIEEFSAAAGKTNAPGNDVFDSNNPKEERKKLQVLLKDYDKKRNALSLTVQNVDPSFLKLLNPIDQSMKDMLSEAELIFSAFEKGREQFAGTRMATMDRKFAVLNDNLRNLRRAVVESQQNSIGNHNSQLRMLAFYEKILALTLLVLLTIVFWYGRRLKAKISGQQETILDRESRILNAEKLASLGSVSSAIIHEINNPLAIIGGKISVLERHLNEQNRLDEKSKASIETLNKMVERISIIIRGVRTMT